MNPYVLSVLADQRITELRGEQRAARISRRSRWPRMPRARRRSGRVD